MSERFRQSMHWLHTWAGLVLGALLFAIFWMGTLAVFDREIDRWMMPKTRVAMAETVSLDAIARTMHPLAVAAEARRWAIQMPSERQPTARAYFDTKTERKVLHLDPATGRVLAEERTLGATGFFYPFHFSLFIHHWDLGEWLAGLAALTMMTMCVSGVVIHRRIFADFFTLRIVRKPQRTTLDLHNVTGVLGLPFNFLIAFTGLVIFMSVYLPGIRTVLYPDGPAAFAVEAYGTPRGAPTGEKADLASLDAMVAEAQRRWGGGTPATILVFNPGDKAASVFVNQDTSSRVTMDANTVVCDGSTGRVVAGPHRYSPAMRTFGYLSGMHYAWFRHAALRWLYFLSGLAGCVLIATGFLFWVQSRAKRHERHGVRGMALIRGLSVGATAGIIFASLMFLVANRVLPDQPFVVGVPRQWLEVRIFFAAWLLGFVHAWLRPRTAWRDQTLAIAIGGVVAVALNAITTADALPVSLFSSQWSVAWVDLVLLLTAGICFGAAQKLSRTGGAQKVGGVR
ncbi:PepSY-associated TM helix domain-containing protein [Sphingomonas sp. Leaf4]|uniref:PepSY-associated TM helix domain-containing protein n=1 Tax=Sphingomonas sp. Leaf4 TaxID=2876553 RepID=UPI001E2B28C3|nr:PepSY-associated TM helix domain-containing protein [Sphingomonas sp. Leaf4]